MTHTCTFETWPDGQVRCFECDAEAPKTAASRQQAYRDRQRALGRAPRLLYLTDAEKAAVDKLIRDMRATT